MNDSEEEVDHNSLSSERNARCDFVGRVPVRLYESKGTIFELYDGGQPYPPMVIGWEHLVSIEGLNSQPPELHRRLEDKQ